MLSEKTRKKTTDMTVAIILILMILLLLAGTCMFWLRHSVICPNCRHKMVPHTYNTVEKFTGKDGTEYTEVVRTRLTCSVCGYDFIHERRGDNGKEDTSKKDKDN